MGAPHSADAEGYDLFVLPLAMLSRIVWLCPAIGTRYRVAHCFPWKVIEMFR